jgi:hypothetical protein
MVKYIQDSGMTRPRLKKVMAFKYGQMVLNTKVSGIMIWHVVMEDLY